jgi:hypothetical protein
MRSCAAALLPSCGGGEGKEGRLKLLARQPRSRRRDRSPICDRVSRLRAYGSVPQTRSLVVEFRGVTHFSATPRDSELPFSEDTCLSSVGGVEPSDPTLSVYSDVPAGWHHVFAFMSGFVLRIGAESVCLLPNDI